MEALVQHLVRPIVKHPDEVAVNAIEGEAAVVLELTVNPEDRPALVADDERTLRAIRMLVSAAAGKRKATVELLGAAEASASDSDEDDDDSDEDDDDSDEDDDDSDEDDDEDEDESDDE